MSYLDQAISQAASQLESKLKNNIMEKLEDNVNHPKHYEGSCSMECIDIMQMIFGPEIICWYCLVNAFKYMWRWRNKNGIEDLDKADWYLNKYRSIEFTPLSRMSTIYKDLSRMMEKFREEIKDD